MHRQSGPVVVSVKGQMYATGPLISYRPHNFRTISLIEHVSRVNEEEAPVLLLGVLLLQEEHHMYADLNTGLHPPRQFVSSTRLLSLLDGSLQVTLIHQPLPSLTHYHWPDPWMLIQVTETARH